MSALRKPEECWLSRQFIYSGGDQLVELLKDMERYQAFNKYLEAVTSTKSPEEILIHIMSLKRMVSMLESVEITPMKKDFNESNQLIKIVNS